MITRTIFRVLWAATVFVFAFAVTLGVLFLLGGLWVGDELRALAPQDPVLATGSSWVGAAIFALTVVPALTIVPALVAVIIGEACLPVAQHCWRCRYSQALLATST